MLSHAPFQLQFYRRLSGSNNLGAGPPGVCRSRSNSNQGFRRTSSIPEQDMGMEEWEWISVAVLIPLIPADLGVVDGRHYLGIDVGSVGRSRSNTFADGGVCVCVILVHIYS